MGSGRGGAAPPGLVTTMNHDTNSDSGSASGASGSEEETEYEMTAAKGRGEPDPLALFSACISTWADGQTGKPSSGSAQRGQMGGKQQQRVHRTAEERKQRRLEINRLAAKRAYYRRQGKANAMQDENDRLRDMVQQYEAALSKLGVDPRSIVGEEARTEAFAPPSRSATTKRASKAPKLSAPKGAAADMEADPAGGGGGAQWSQPVQQQLRQPQQAQERPCSEASPSLGGTGDTRRTTVHVLAGSPAGGSSGRRILTTSADVGI